MSIDLSAEQGFVMAIAERVRTFAASRDAETPAVRVTLSSGDNFLVASMEAQPGGGMITLAPIPEDLGELVQESTNRWVTPNVLIVRITDIRLIEILAEQPERVQLGFQLPERP